MGDTAFARQLGSMKNESMKTKVSYKTHQHDASHVTEKPGMMNPFTGVHPKFVRNVTLFQCASKTRTGEFCCFNQEKSGSIVGSLFPVEAAAPHSSLTHHSDSLG
jgi:hypothetical protein